MRSQAIGPRDIIPFSEPRKAMALKNGPAFNKSNIAPTEGNLALKIDPEPEFSPLNTPSKTTQKTPAFKFNSTCTKPPLSTRANSGVVRQSEVTLHKAKEETEDPAKTSETDSSQTPPVNDTEPQIRIKPQEDSTPRNDNSLWWCVGGFLTSLVAGALTYVSNLPDQVKQSLWFMETAIGVVCGLTGIGKAVMPSHSNSNSHNPAVATTFDDSYSN